MLPYIETHNHTFYSPLDGLSSPEEYCTRAKEVGIDTLAITDHGTLAGHRHMQRATEAAGIKPILGVEAYFSQTDRFDKRDKNTRDDGTSIYNHIILLAKNDQGVLDLNALSEIGWTEGFYFKPRIDFEVLDKYGDNLIVLSGCMSGVVSKNILEGNYEQADYWTRKLKDRFDEDFYMEIQSHNPDGLNHSLLNYADAYDIKPVVTGDCHYADPADKEFEEAFLLLGTKLQGKIEDPDMDRADKMNLLDRLNYLYPERRMSFKDIDVFLERAELRQKALSDKGIDRTDVFTNTLEIGEKVGNYQYRKDEWTLPEFPGIDIDEEFKKMCRVGMKARTLEGKPEYEERLAEEQKVILDKGLAVYFVIKADILKYCRDNGINYGAGRGSAAGSLVTYVLQITEVEPVINALLFWRFLDPDRLDMPDIDTDIEDKRRHEVKNYISQKFGADHVASVSTLTTYKGKSAVKSACRVICVPPNLTESVIKELTEYPSTDKEGTQKNLEEYRTNPKLAAFRKKYPDVIRIAEKLADRVNGYGIHPSGLIITNKPIREYTGVETRKLPGTTLRQTVINLDGDAAAELGLVKYDFLGLKSISVVADCVDFIKKNHGISINFKGLKEDDPKVFRMLSEGNTVGVAQSEAEASTDIIRKMGIDNFNDLAVSNALVRPGAWDAFGKDYLLRKQGRQKTTYPTDETKWFLEDTYGFPLYQEQTMLICTELAGMSKGDANKIRKLTAKKKSIDELMPFKNKFFDGALKKISSTATEKVWSDIEKTANYSFNKCLHKDTLVEVWVRNKKHPIQEDTMGEITVERLRAQIILVGHKCDFFVRGPEWIKDGKVGPGVWHPVVGVHDNGVQDITRIWLDSETWIDSTANHKHRLQNRWKEAGLIWQNDVIWTNEGKKKVWKRTTEGQEQTFDLEFESEPHAFYANGFLTHNSHAFAYSKLSYAMAYLKYYYPAEFMAALLNNETDQGSVSQYLAECKRLGLKVETPNVNKSDIGYSCEGKVIYMGLANVKGVGRKKAEHIIHNRPYASYAELVEKVHTPKSGLDVGTLKTMDTIGATEFWDHLCDQQLAKESRYEYLGIPSFDTGLLNRTMSESLVKLNDFGSGMTAPVGGIVTEIVSKPTWTKVSVVDETGTAQFFVEKEHGLVKGHKYLFILDGSSMIMYMDMAEFDMEHPIADFLNYGGLRQGTWAVAAKSRWTKPKPDKPSKEMATLVYSHDGVLKSCVAFESHLPMAREGFQLGNRIRIAVKKGKMGDILEGVKVYEQPN